jgi:ABC-type sugar transport system substrate-binding protein
MCSAFLSTFSLVLAQQSSSSLNCDPCIDRPSYTIKAITHGTKTSGFWKHVRAAAIQAAIDMRVNLEFDLHDTYDPEQMAADIVKAATGANPPHALLVSIPSPLVHNAITTAVSNHVPVFGINSGYQFAESLGVLGFVAMEEYIGGVEAANVFLSAKNNITRALFVNTEQGNTALDARRRGFNDTLQNANSAETIAFYPVEKLLQVDVLVLDMTADDSEILSKFEDATRECTYDAILLGGKSPLEFATFALETNGCLPPKSLLGTFDISSTVYDDIAVGKLHFAVSQQQYLQGALGVVMASVYATTGQSLSSRRTNPSRVSTTRVLQ